MAKTPERSKTHQFSNSLEWSQGLPQSRLVTPYANDLRDLKTIILPGGTTIQVRADSPLLEKYSKVESKRRITPPTQEPIPFTPEITPIDIDEILSINIPEIPDIPPFQIRVLPPKEQKTRPVSKSPTESQEKILTTYQKYIECHDGKSPTIEYLIQKTGLSSSYIYSRIKVFRENGIILQLERVHNSKTKDTRQKSVSTKNIVLTAHQKITEENNGLLPSISELTQSTGLCKSAVYHHLRILEAEGVIKREKIIGSKTELTPKQQNFLAVYQTLTQENNGVPPSTEQMAKKLKISKGAISHSFGFFRENGLISELPNSQEKILNILRINKGKPLSIDQLAKSSGFKKQTIFRCLRGLESKGILAYQLIEPDVQITATPSEKPTTKQSK